LNGDLLIGRPSQETLHDWPIGFSFCQGRGISILVHCGGDVRASHQFLLNTHGCSGFVQPSARTTGFSAMTIEAIAKRTQVSVPTVYATFESKTGILAALLDQSMFGPDYDEVVRQAQSAIDPETRLRLSAAVARQIRGSQSAAFDLLRGAGVVAPELAKLQRDRENLRYDRVGSLITFLQKSGRLRPGLSHRRARDIFWMLTGGDVYRMLVRERRWSSHKYQQWLADALVELLLTHP
jgi:AcrR family transcriptional regulator